MPHLLLPAVIVRRPPSAARHPPPIICCQLSLQNLPPNQVDCRRRHRPLSLHRSPPRRLTRRIVRRPPSARQHCCRRHRCNPRSAPRPLSLRCPRCLPAAAVVAATPSLLRPLSSHLPPPALVALSHSQRDNIPPTVVTVTS